MNERELQHAETIRTPVGSGIGFLNGKPVRWDDTTVTHSKHRSWFLKRLDLIAVDEANTLHVHEGKPALWSQVPPECPATQLTILVVTQRSRVGSLLRCCRRCVGRVRRGRA